MALQKYWNIAMLNRILVALLVSFVSLSVAAIEPSHREAAKELIKVSKMEQLIEQMEPQMDLMFDQIVAEVSIPQERTDAMNAFMADLKVLMNDAMGWDALYEEFIRIYTKAFTEPEINEMVEFYESPLGQKIINRMPLIMQESMQMTQRSIEELMPKIDALTEKHMNEL